MRLSALVSYLLLFLSPTLGQFNTTDFEFLFESTTETENCGSLFVSVDTTSPTSESLVSASTQFAPFSYSLSETQVVLLDSEDDLCDSFIIGYDGYIILVMVDESTCSAQSQVYNAEIAGAVAVLFYNSQDDTQVYHLDADEAANTPSIPARMISQFDGEAISMVIENGDDIIIQLTCADGSYPETICAFDTDGDHWELDGDYEEQTNMEVNGHPVWRKHGYYDVYPERYMWLDTDEWRWVISNSTELNSSIETNFIEAYCPVNSLNITFDPSACDDWRVLVDEDGNLLSQEILNDLIVAGAICEISDNYFCLTSGTTGRDAVTDYEGTYHQQHNLVPLWTREDVGEDLIWSYITQIDRYEWCERNQGGGGGPGGGGNNQFTCTNYTNSFILYDENNDEKMICKFDNATQSIGKTPEDCEPWYIISTNSRNGQLEYEEDDYFDIDDGWCSGYINETNNFDSYPNQICLSNTYNNSYYSEDQYLYGTYQIIEGDSYGDAPIWRHVRSYNTSYVSYFFLDDQDDIWILDDSVPEDESDTIRFPMGECDAENIDDPTFCAANNECWDIEDTRDCAIWNLTAGSCPDEEFVSKDAYVDYICVTFQDNDGFRSKHANGLYSLSDDMINGRYYYSFYNSTSDRTFYIYYYDLLKYWIYSEGIYGDNADFDDIGLYCKEYNEYDLLNCNWEINDERFDKTTDYDWEIHSCPNGTYQYVLEIAPTQMPVVAPTRWPTVTRPTRPPVDNGGSGGNGGRPVTTDPNNGGSNSSSSSGGGDGVVIALSVILSIVVIVLIGIAVVYFGKRNKGHGGFGSGFAEEVDDGNLGGLPLSDLQDHKATPAGTGGGTMRAEESSDDDNDNDKDEEPPNPFDDNPFEDGPSTTGQ